MTFLVADPAETLEHTGLGALCLGMSAGTELSSFSVIAGGNPFSYPSSPQLKQPELALGGSGQSDLLCLRGWRLALLLGATGGRPCLTLLGRNCSRIPV